MLNSKLVLGAALFSLAGVASAQNGGALLSSNGSLFNISSSSTTTTGTLPTTSTGANPSANFVVGSGTLRNAFTGFWYYRVSGDTRERNFHSASSRTVSGTNEVTWDFNNITNTAGVVSGVAASMNYRLFGAVDGQSAYVFSDLTIANNTASTLDIDLFWVYDVDLAGTFPGDVVAPLENISGVRRTWNVSDTGWNMKYTGFGAAGAGAGGFSAINGQMTDASLDNFIPDLNAGGLAAGDQALAMQWRFSIGVGASQKASGVMAVGRPGANIEVVPEPASMTALALGAAAMLRRRRAAKK